MAAETVENHSFTSKYSAWKKQPRMLSVYLFIDIAICFYQNWIIHTTLQQHAEPILVALAVVNT